MVSQPYRTTQRVLAVLGDLTAAAMAYLLGFYLRSLLPLPFTMGLMPFNRFQHLDHFWLALLLSQILLLYFLGLYDRLWNQPWRQTSFPLALGVAVQAIFLGIFYGFFSRTDMPRTLFPLFWAGNTLLLILWRSSLRRLFLLRQVRRLLIVGCHQASANLIRLIEKHHAAELEIVGLVSAPEDSIFFSSSEGEARQGAGQFAGYPLLGTTDDLPSILRRCQPEEIILSTGGGWQETILNSLSGPTYPNLRWSLLPNTYEILIGKPTHFKIRDIPLIEIADDPNPPSRLILKRLLDILCSAAALLLLSPLLLATALYLRVMSGRPVFYTQERVGKNGRPFRMLKFRSMVPQAEKQTGAVFSEFNDPRITPEGKWLRKTRLDEIPQLLNILRGQMSFIGPRPERPVFVEQFLKTIPGYNQRTRVKPGLTGLAQVNGYYDTDPYHKLKYDLFYIHNFSLWLDFQILIDTLKIMIAGKGR